MKIEPRYRIVKKYERSNHDDKVSDYFIVEYLGLNVKKTISHFTKWYKWKPYKVTVYGFGDCYKEIVRFKTTKEAQERIGNLLTPIPDNEVISEV